MRYLFKLRRLSSNLGGDLLNPHRSFRVNLSSLYGPKLSKLHNASKAQRHQVKNDRVYQNLGSLFSEIVEILGTEKVIADQNPTGSSKYGETNFSIADQNGCSSSSQGACLNAQKVLEHETENLSVLESNLMGVSSGIDASPTVQKVTEIVRGENGCNSMEERLENVNLEYNVEIVEKVLKRCYKVPDLALRFFNWVKLRKGLNQSAETYNTMIYIAGEAKKFGVVEELVQEMEKNSHEKNIKTWTILIAHYGKAKFISKALSTFEKMKKYCIEPDVTAYKTMLGSLCNAGKADLAQEFYKEMIHRNMGLSVGLYKQLLKCLARSGDVAAVYAVGDSMIKVSKISESLVYGLMLKSFCIAGKIRESLELIRNLKDKNVNIGSENFETLVKGLCRADMIDDALEIMDIMKKKDSVDGKVYGIIINGYLSRNDVSKAFDLFRTIKESGQLPTVSTYTNLMQCLIWKNEFQKALELYNEMVAMGVQLDCVAITAIVVGFIRQNHLSEAWNVFKSIEEKGFKATRKSYIILMKELFKASRTDEIFKVLNEMQASRLTIEDDIFRWVLSCVEKNGEVGIVEKIKQMQKTFKFSPKEGVSAIDSLHGQESAQKEQECPIHDSRESTSRSYCKDDLHEICQILSSSMNWSSIQEKLEKYAVQFSTELVMDILRNCNLHSGAALRFFSWVGKQTGYSHNTESYNMAIKISGRAKDFKHMRSLFHEMRRNGFPPTSDTWTIMITQYGRTGLTDIALGNFRDMKASGCRPNESTYKFLIIYLCGKKGRRVDEAIKMFPEMMQAGFHPDKELVESYLGCLCEAEKLLEAKSCIESLRKIGFTNTLACSMYVRALCRAGKLEEATEMIDGFGPEKHTLDLYTCGTLVHGLLRRGRIEEALAKVEYMKQVGINPTVHIYTSLIVHFFKEKQICKALEIFEKMKEVDCQPTSVTFSAIIRGYMDMGKVADAWGVFNRMKQNGPLPDFKTYSMFIASLCRTGNSEEALKLISEMLDTGIIPSTVNFRTVFYGLNREGKQNLARTVIRKKIELQNIRKIT